MKKIETILVSQPAPQSQHNFYAEMEAEFGVHFDFRQLIKVEGLTAREFRQQHVYLENYTAVICSSKLAIDHFFRMCDEMHYTVPDSMHYYCISEAVACYLQKFIQYRKRKVFYATHNRFEELLPAMNRRPNEKYMMILSDVHNDDVLNMFAANKIEVRPAIMYRTVPVAWPQGTPFDYDMVVIFTPTGAHALKQNFPNLQSGDKVIAGFGQSTIDALAEVGLKADIAECQSIATALRRYLESNN